MHILKSEDVITKIPNLMGDLNSMLGLKIN